MNSLPDVAEAIIVYRKQYPEFEIPLNKILRIFDSTNKRRDLTRQQESNFKTMTDTRSHAFWYKTWSF